MTQHARPTRPRPPSPRPKATGHPSAGNDEPGGATGYFATAVDSRTGCIRASGQLTPAGADLLVGTVESLVRLGRTDVTVDLAAVTGVDAEGARRIDELCLLMSDRGGSVTVDVGGAANPPAR